MMFLRGSTGAVLGLALLHATVAIAISPADKCVATKLKAAGKYTFCRLKTDAKAIKTTTRADYMTCDSAFALKWARAETNGGGMCPSNGDKAPVQALITEHTGNMFVLLTGGPRFVDNADGTITDNLTGLDWEKKTELDNLSNFTNLHDADNAYRWAGTCSIADKYCQPTAAAAALCAANTENGTTGCDACTVADGACSASSTIWTVAADRNTASFGGHTDWRVPTRAELISIVDYAHADTTPWVDVAFHGASCGGACTDVTDPDCACTEAGIPGIYASASSVAPNPTAAWGVGFGPGNVNPEQKNILGYSLRIVRGGS